jgi:hypothetical protein
MEIPSKDFLPSTLHTQPCPLNSHSRDEVEPHPFTRTLEAREARAVEKDWAAMPG